MIPPRQFQQRLARLRLDVRGINHHEFPERETLRRDEVHDFKRLLGHAQIVLVVTDETAANIRRDDLGPQEMLARERAFPRSA